jgi:hypothetical protein
MGAEHLQQAFCLKKACKKGWRSDLPKFHGNNQATQLLADPPMMGQKLR